MTKFKKYLGITIVGSLLLSSVSIYAYGNPRVSLSTRSYKTSSFKYYLDVNTYGNERDIPSSSVDKISLRYYVEDDYGSLLHKNYTYQKYGNFVELNDKSLSIAPCDYVDTESVLDVVYTNGLSNYDSAINRNDIADVAYYNKGVENQKITPYLIDDINKQYLEHLKSIGININELSAYAKGDIFNGEYGNLGSIVIEVLDEISIGDTVPYIYINPEQTEGYIVNKSKDGNYNVVEVMTQKERSNTDYMIWKIK